MNIWKPVTQHPKDVNPSTSQLPYFEILELDKYNNYGGIRTLYKKNLEDFEFLKSTVRWCFLIDLVNSYESLNKSKREYEQFMNLDDAKKIYRDIITSNILNEILPLEDSYYSLITECSYNAVQAWNDNIKRILEEKNGNLKNTSDENEKIEVLNELSGLLIMKMDHLDVSERIEIQKLINSLRVKYSNTDTEKTYTSTY